MARALPAISLAAAILLGSAGSLGAAEDVLRMVPREALGFVVIHSLGDTDAKIQKLVPQSRIPSSSPLFLVKALLGISKGLDEKRSVVLIAMPPEKPDAEPAVVLLMPVSDYRQFLEPLHPVTPEEKVTEVKMNGKAALAAKRGHYAVLAAAEHRKALQTVLDFKRGLDADLADLRPWLEENDAAAVATTQGIKLLCAKGIRTAGMIREHLPYSPNKQIHDYVLAMADRREKVFTLIQEEISSVAVGGHVDSQGTLKLTSRIQVSADGKIDRLLAQVKPAKAKLLAGLPGGPFAIAVGSSHVGPVMQPLIDFQTDMLMFDFPTGIMKQVRSLYGLTEEQLKQWDAATRKSLQDSYGLAMVMGPGETPLENCVCLWHVSDAAKYMANYEAYARASSKLAIDATKPILPTIDVAKTRVDGAAALRVEVTMPQPQPMSSEAAIAHLLGPDRDVVAYLAAADEHTIVAGYRSEAALRRGLRAARRPEAGFAAKADVAKTAALLPDDAQAVAYLSPKGMMSLVNHIEAKFAMPGASATYLPAFPATPPIGIAFKIVPHQIQTTVIVPPEFFPALFIYRAAVREGDRGPLERALQEEKKEAPDDK